MRRSRPACSRPPSFVREKPAQSAPINMTRLRSRGRIPMQAAVAPSFERAALERAEWQKVVFSGQPRQSDLLELAAAGLPGTPVRINVHRNQPFELIGAYAVPFFRYVGWEPDFVYSAYDDSLGFQGHRQAHVEFLWLDFG